MKQRKIPQDIVGDIAILKFKRKTPWLIKYFSARQFLKNHKNIKTVLEKIQGFSGELRIPKTKHLAGEKTKEAIYKENNCLFKFNTDETYFSPRLSNERKVIAEEVAKIAKQNSKILILFAGIAPYPIVIAKKLKQKNKKFHIYSNELNKKANEFAKENIILNKLQNQITILPGDANKIKPIEKEVDTQRALIRSKRPRFLTFDIILMPRPNLKDTFLKSALKLSKKGTTIFYHGFGTKEEVLAEIKKDTKNKIGKIKIRKAGDIGAHKFRWQASFRVK